MTDRSRACAPGRPAAPASPIAEDTRRDLDRPTLQWPVKTSLTEKSLMTWAAGSPAAPPPADRAAPDGFRGQT